MTSDISFRNMIKPLFFLSSIDQKNRIAIKYTMRINITCISLPLCFQITIESS